MQLAGEPSWSIFTSGAEDLDALLHVRDALRLPADSPTDPPAWLTPFTPAWRDLDDTTPHRGHDLSAAWRSWWRDTTAGLFLDHGVDLHASPLAPTWASTTHRAPWLETAPIDLGLDALAQRLDPAAARYWALSAPTEPPGSPPLAGVHDPLLRRAARALWPAAHEWAGQREVAWSGNPETWMEGSHLASPSQALDHDVYQRAADDVAFDLGVPMDRLQATLIEIEAPTAWWQAWAPGAVLVSRLAMTDSATAIPVLHHAFRAAATAPRRP